MKKQPNLFDQWHRTRTERIIGALVHEAFEELEMEGFPPIESEVAYEDGAEEDIFNTDRPKVIGCTVTGYNEQGQRSERFVRYPDRWEERVAEELAALRERGDL